MEKKKKKKKKKKAKKKKKKEKDGKHVKKSQKWHQGRDKIPAHIPQVEKHDILQSNFRKHFESWKKAWPKELEQITETTRIVAGDPTFQLGCRTCMAYVAAHPDDKSLSSKKNGNKLSIGEYGHAGVRKHDLLRHFQGARSKLHKDALAWQTEQVCEKKHEDAREDVPSSAQFRIAYAILKENPLAATGKMYEKNCIDARSAGDQNVPPYRCSNPIFRKISQSIGRAVVHDLHRRLAKRSNTNPPEWLCLAEDNGGGISQKCVRVAFKDFAALDILLDWSHHYGKKEALY